MQMVHSRESRSATPSVVGAPEGRERATGAHPGSGIAALVWSGAVTSSDLIRLQRLVGNRAIGGMVTRADQRRINPVQRTCSSSCDCASCAGGHSSNEETKEWPVDGAAAVQRHPDQEPTNPTGEQESVVEATRDAGVQRDPAGVVVQRQADPSDLTGTQFESLDPMLKTKLADRTVFNWGSKARLAEALADLPNANIASMSRVGAMISASASFLWAQVRRITGAWITDNFGMGVEWSDPGGLAATLAASPGWCRDNPVTARWYHGSTNSFRQIPGQPGAASLHVTTSGRPDVHIDAHQPIEGKETRWPWAGQCNLDLSAWWDHAGDVIAGGGATGTAVGRYAAARGNINTVRRSPYFDPRTHQPKLTQASQLLDTIANNVQGYAAMGNMVGDEWEGDRQMLRDRPVMEALEHAERLINEVLIEQMQDEQRSQPMM